MAITGTFNFRGASIPGAYIRLSAYRWGKDSSLQGVFSVFANRAAAQPEEITGDPAQPPIEYVHMDAVPIEAGESPHDVLYARLMAMFPEFEDEQP